MKTALFFGSFNPVHNGHMAMALFLKQKQLFEQIWMVVSPGSPFKEKEELAHENDRLMMMKLAIQAFPFLQVCDAELYLPIPSYTIETLHYLEIQYPNNEFSLILGADNLATFHKWKNYEEILNKYKIYVYPRDHGNCEHFFEHQHIIYINDAPLLPVSATEIRSLLKQQRSVIKYLPVSVIQYIADKQLYN